MTHTKKLNRIFISTKILVAAKQRTKKKNSTHKLGLGRFVNHHRRGVRHVRDRLELRGGGGGGS